MNKPHTSHPVLSNVNFRFLLLAIFVSAVMTVQVLGLGLAQAAKSSPKAPVVTTPPTTIPAPVTTTPPPTVAPAPITLKAPVARTSVTSDSVVVSWGAVTGAASYNVQYREEGTSVWSPLTTTSSLSAAHGDSFWWTYYQYRVNAVSSTGVTSAWSSTVRDAVFGAPKDVWACQYSSSLIQIGWTAETNSYLTSYFIAPFYTEIPNTLTTQGQLTYLMPASDMPQDGVAVFGSQNGGDETYYSNKVGGGQLYDCY